MVDPMICWSSYNCAGWRKISGRRCRLLPTSVLRKLG